MPKLKQTHSLFVLQRSSPCGEPSFGSLERNPQLIGLRSILEVEMFSDQKNKELDLLSSGGKPGCSLLHALFFHSKTFFNSALNNDTAFTGHFCSNRPSQIQQSCVATVSWADVEATFQTQLLHSSSLLIKVEKALPYDPQALDHLSGECLALGRAWKYWRAITP